MCCLVVDVTDEGGKRDVAYIAFVRYAFEGISEEDIDKGYPRGPFIVCMVLSFREFI